jgi:hypothetical protein
MLGNPSPQMLERGAQTSALRLFELAFFGHALVRFSRALDPVRELSGLVRKLAKDLVEAIRSHPERIAAAQLNFLADPKPMRGHARLH